MFSRINSAVALIAAFATLVLCAPEPQNTSQAAEDINSFVSALETDPVVASIISAFPTESTAIEAAITAIVGVESSFVSAVSAGHTPSPFDTTGAQSHVASLINSIYTAELGIVTKNGFLTTASATTSNGSAPSKSSSSSKATAHGGKSSASSSATSSSSSSSSSSKAGAAPTGSALGISAGALAGILGVAMAL